MTRRPKRRLTVNIEIGADSREALLRALDEIQFSMEGGSVGPIVSGGCDSGWTLDLVEDSEMTHDKYFEAVVKWNKEKEEVSP